MVSEEQLAKTLHYIEAGHQDGARLMTGGGSPKCAAFEHGYWVQPTVFAGVTQDMRVAREEIFGPVLSASCARRTWTTPSTWPRPLN